MRADRLLSILMLLQSRGRMTARQLAGELEVSERTIYRDIDALSASGVPVYAERGPGGGCELLADYRTTLTGLTEDEVRALFMLSIPAPLAELGVSGELKAALFKLSAALPASRRLDEARARQRIHLDSAPWSQSIEPAPHLHTIHRAIWEDRRLHVTYLLPWDTHYSQVVEPYGLVAKVNTWHLVCRLEGHIRADRVSRIIEARVTGETFERPADFDLAAYWSQWCREHEANRPRYAVTARVSPELMPWFPLYLDAQTKDTVEVAGPADPSGWVTLRLTFETFEDARTRLLGLGRAIEVLEPRALRESVVDFARQIVDFYGA